MSEQIKTQHAQESPPLEEIPTASGELVESLPDDGLDVDTLMPSMNVNMPDAGPIMERKPDIITDEELTGIYDEILGMLRKEHEQVTDYIDNFAEMVINGGDPSTSSKEALVNLVNIRTGIPDKMVKIADLMTRLKMKSPDTFKPYMTANQTNNVVIGDTTGERRALLEHIKKAKKKDKKK
jgi:hypothetical protein